jgi:hypothetical protein
LGLFTLGIGWQTRREWTKYKKNGRENIGMKAMKSREIFSRNKRLFGTECWKEEMIFKLTWKKHMSDFYSEQGKINWLRQMLIQ